MKHVHIDFSGRNFDKEDDDTSNIHRLHYKVDLDSVTREEALQLKAGLMPERLVIKEEYHCAVNEDDANVVSSRIDDGSGNHAPVLDIDFPAKLVPSSTADHYHLYLDTIVSWESYEKLLVALEDCGIISKGYMTASIARKATYVRKKDVLKKKKAVDS